MRGWYAQRTPAQRRVGIQARDPEKVREQDRKKMARRRVYGTSEQRQKIAARAAVRHALTRGDLERGPCEFGPGDCSGLIHAHHDDYSKPLDVRWVCRGHHESKVHV